MNKNVIESIGEILKLQSDKEYMDATNVFLNAESTEEECKEARKIIFDTIAEKIKNSDLMEDTNDKTTLLSSLIETMEKDSFNDQQFYNFLYLVNGLVNTLDIDYLIQVAEKTSSAQAKRLLDQYKSNNDTKLILEALEAMKEAVKANASLRKSKLNIEMPKKITNILNFLEDSYQEIKNSFNNLSHDELLKAVNTYAKFIEQANKKIEKNLSFEPKLRVKMAEAFKKLVLKNKKFKLKKKKKFKLKRKIKAGKLLKKLAFTTVCVIVIATAGKELISFIDWKFSEGPHKELDLPEIPNTKVEVMVDAKTLLSIATSTVKINTLAQDTLKTVEKENIPTESSTPENQTTESSKEEKQASSTTSSTPVLTESSAIEATPAPTPVQTTPPAPTKEPTIVATPEPTPSINEATMSLINNAATNTYNNWITITDSYDYETIVELTKCLNGYESTISSSTAYSIILDMANKAAIPGANNATYGEKVFDTVSIDFSNLLINNQEGLSAVQSMQSCLNGAITDLDNLKIYAERALSTEAIIIEMGKTSGGIGINSGDPAARILWSSLATATNAVTGVLGDDFSVTLDGITYSQKTLNNATLYDTMANNAVSELANQKQK